MIKSQLELDNNRRNHFEKLAKQLPQMIGALRDVTVEVYKDGTLSTKAKRLIALAIALGAVCRNFILAQTQHALGNGATKEEIVETISVVLSMRGTTCVAS